MQNFKIIFETIAGSHLYGTNLEGSDMDWRGIALEPKESLLGLHNFEQFEEDKIGATNGNDRVIYGLRKFVTLALGQNPNIIELLFAPIGLNNLSYLGISPTTCNLEWMQLILNQDWFLSRKVCETFIGYAVSQMKRMETHYRWMTTEPPEKPAPYYYGLRLSPDGAPKWADEYNHNRYTNDLKHYTQYHTWLENRNPKRHDLEELYKYDTKNAMHLVRLLQEGEQLLKKGYLIFPLPNAKELLDIRNGSMTYDEVIKYMETKRFELNEVRKTSMLPEEPRRDDVEKLVIQLNSNYLRNNS
jgi:predicted nucleotidyltransferase